MCESGRIDLPAESESLLVESCRRSGRIMPFYSGTTLLGIRRKNMMKKVRNMIKRRETTFLVCAMIMTVLCVRLETAMAEEMYDVLGDGEPEVLTAEVPYDFEKVGNTGWGGIPDNTAEAENIGESTQEAANNNEQVNTQENLQENTKTDQEGTKEATDVNKPDFSLSMEADAEILKAGEIAVYEIRIANTGGIVLTDLKLSSSFSCPKVTQEWQPAVNLTAEGAEAHLSLLEPGQEVLLYLAAQLIPEQTNPLTHNVEVSVCNPDNPLEKIKKEVVVKSGIEPLKVDFSVTKTADRQVAVPGDTITYQICIRNTGERTLHSVVGTERFVNSGLQAKFLEQEGVVLNESKDKAMIAQILPGDSVTLAARVILPGDEVNQELINQITVITAETGEQVFTSQASVRLEQLEMTPAPVPTDLPAEYTYNTDEEAKKDGSRNPKTDDFSGIELFAALLAISVAYMIMSLILLIGKKKHFDLGREERNH